MSHKPVTILEINVARIQKTLKRLERLEITIKDCGLNERFNKLKLQSEPWYEDLHPKYITLAKKLNNI